MCEESNDPCAGCQQKQVCSIGVFIPIGEGLRPVCVHPCDVDDVREWISRAKLALETQDE